MKKLINMILIISPALAILISPLYGQKVEIVTRNQDDLLARYEKSDRIFKRLQIGDIVSYFHQRMIGDAIVEKDFIRYQFEVSTEELIEQKIQWREDLPDSITPVITQEQAESIAEGEVQFTRLYFISPASNIFPIKPTPKNPCWIVRSINGDRLLVNIIDAMNGENLGNGIPPPYEGFSLGGPDWGSCDPYFTDWAENAEDWFENMGYDTEMADCPSDALVQSHIQSDGTAMFYELAHGNSWFFHNECPDDHSITAAEVETWIADYASMAFTFLGSCGGMCDQTDNHLSYEFRKGSNEDAVVVGYCGMDQPYCEDCWDYSIDWQEELFFWMNAGYTVQYAFNKANLAYPDCASGNCMRIGGDTGLIVVPVVTRSLCGTCYDGYHGPLTLNGRDYYIRCDITVPSGQTLTIDPHVGLAFLNDSKISANGTLNADGSTGEIRFVSSENDSKGMKFVGQIRVINGGQIKIYE